MFILHFTNVTCSSDGRAFDDMESAIAHGRECGFEFSVVEVENADPFIWGDSHRIASWTVFGGLRRY